MSDDLDARRPVIVTMPDGIDAGNAKAVGETLDAAIARGAVVVVADCTRTTFCDSVGFNTLLLTNQKARDADAELLFVIARNGQLRRVLELMEMQDALAVYPTIDDAVTASRSLRSSRGAAPDDSVETWNGLEFARRGERHAVQGRRPAIERFPVRGWEHRLQLRFTEMPGRVDASGDAFPERLRHVHRGCPLGDQLIQGITGVVGLGEVNDPTLASQVPEVSHRPLALPGVEDVEYAAHEHIRLA